MKRKLKVSGSAVSGLVLSGFISSGFMSICISSGLALSMAASLTPSAQAADATASAGKVEEIVITALKRETRLLDTPLPVAAFNGSDLERNGALNMRDFLQFAPGVSLDQSTISEQRLAIRGLASVYGNSPVGFYIDEVPYTALTVTLLPDVRSFDLERVEVLRGPQGTLYGASSLGGTIRTLTRDPVHNEFQAKVDTVYTDTDHGGMGYGVKGAVNIPLIDDRLSLRLVGTQENQEGWIKVIKPFAAFANSQHNNFDIWTGRAKLRFTPTDDIDIVLGYWRNKSDNDDNNLADDQGQKINLLAAVFDTKIDSDLYSAKVDIDFDAFTLVSSTSYVDYGNDNFFVDFVGGRSLNHTQVFNQELRLTSSSTGPFVWTVGGIYTENETFFDFFFNLPGFFVNESTQDNDSTSYAFYGEGTYTLSDAFDVTLGLRYYNDDITRNDTQFKVPQPEVKNQFSDWSPRVNLAYRPMEDVLVYATVSKGFRSGLTQPSIAIAAAKFVGLSISEDVNSEDAWNYELGTKFTAFDGALTVDAVAYYIDWKDLQASLLLNPVVFAFENVSDAEGKGFEAAVSWLPVEGLSFTLTGNLNDTTYSDTTRDAFGRVVFKKGDQIQFVPEYTVTGAIDYSVDLGGGWRGSARASIEQVGKRTTTNDALVVVEGKDNTRVNARFGAETEAFGGTLGAYLFIENLTNDDSRINPAGTALANGYFSRYRPRTFGLNLKVDL